MLFEQWVQQHNLQNKVVFVDKVREANRLVRRYNKKGNLSNQLKMVKAEDLARTIVLNHMALDNVVGEFYYYNDSMCAVLVERILKEQTGSHFVPESSISSATAAEVLRVMNMIRSGAPSEKVKADALSTQTRLRYDQIMSLITAYEECLKEKHAYDKNRLLKEACEILSMDEQAANVVEAQVYGKLMPLELTYMEQHFITLITKEKECTELTYLPSSDSRQVTYHFKKAYGAINEVEAVIRCVLEKQQAFGTVNILYTSLEQEALIRSGLEKEGIPYSMVSGYSAMGNPFVYLMKQILVWGTKGCRGPIISVLQNSQCLDFGKTKSEELPKEEYRQWRKQVETNLLQARQELLDIFAGVKAKQESELVDVADLYRALVNFLKNRKRAKSLQWAVAKPVFDDVCMVLAQKDKVESVETAINDIMSVLEEARITETEQTDSITVMQIDSRYVLEREHNYVIGLSVKNFQVAAKESPVLYDVELEECLDDSRGYVPYAMDSDRIKRQQLLDTLHSLERGEIVLSYCYYDTMNLREGNPARIYMDLMSEYAPELELSDVEQSGYSVCEYQHIEEVVVFYENPEVNCVDETSESNCIDNAADDLENEIYESEYDELLDEEYDEDFFDGGYDEEDEEEFFDEDVGIVKSMAKSPSALQTALRCPRCYYYRYERHIPEPSEQDKDVSVWLNNNERGTLIHKILEEYCEQVLKGKNDVSDKVEETVYTQIFDICVQNMTKEYPYVQQGIFEMERESIRETTHNYLAMLHTELADVNNVWMVQACEYTIEEDVAKCYSIETDDADEGNVLELIYTGFVDRVDSYVDDKGKRHYRLIDYKTGSKEKLESKIEHNLQIQHVLYAKALEDDNSIVDKFLYVYLSEDGVDEITLLSHSLQSLNVEVEEVLYKVLYEEIYDPEERILKTGDGAKKQLCENCVYAQICRDRVGGEL